MLVPAKSLLSWVLLTGIASLMVWGSSPDLISHNKNIFSEHTTPISIANPLSTHKNNSLSTPPQIFSIENDTSENTNNTNTNHTSSTSQPSFSLESYSITGIDGTSGPDDKGINGTGGANNNSIAGIDGTSGPDDDSIAGIDGTSGPDDDSTAGIDGTSGPNDDSTSRCESIPLPCPDLIDESYIIATLGTVTRQENSSLFMIGGYIFKVDQETKTMIDGITVQGTNEINDGEIIIIKGRIDNDLQESHEQIHGTAEQIIITTQINGVITQADVAPEITISEPDTLADKPETITVLEQTIVIPKDTIFSGGATKSSDLKIDNSVKVSGFRLSNGDLSATHIEKLSTNSVDRLTGAIQNLNEIDKTFRVNQLTVNYSFITNITQLNNGVTVDVIGTIDSTMPTVLNATSISVAVSVVDNDVESIYLEGFITEFTSAANFKVGDVTVFSDYNTRFDGNGIDDLALNTKISIKGYLNNSTLIAEEISFFVAKINRHKLGASISKTNETFEWDDVNAKAYRLVILDNHQKIFYDETFDGNTTSAMVEGLPQGSTTFTVYLYTLHGEFWSKDIDLFRGAGTISDAELTSHPYEEERHKEGHKYILLKSTTETFTWNSIDGAQAYRLRIADTTGSDYFNEVFTEPEIVTVYDLPNNGADMDLYVETLYDGWWSSRHYYLESMQSPDIRNATITSHVNGEPLTKSNGTETFTWEDVGAEQYELRIARTMINGWTDILETRMLNGSDTSATVENLPLNSGQVRVRLRTKHSGWNEEKYKFPGVGLIEEAELNGHTNGQVISSASQTFSWSEILGVEKYQLSIGKVYAGRSVFFEDYSNSTTTTNAVTTNEITQDIHNLPRNNAKAYVRLSTQHNGYWAHKDYVLKGTGEFSSAKVTSHESYQRVNTSSTTLRWSDENADEYHLQVKNLTTKPSILLHDQAYTSDTTSVAIDNLPNNATLQIILDTRHGDWWGRKQIAITTNLP
jgi:hypothetical protein